MITLVLTFSAGVFLGLFLFARTWRPSMIKAAALAELHIGDRDVVGDLARALLTDLEFIPEVERELAWKEV